VVRPLEARQLRHRRARFCAMKDMLLIKPASPVKSAAVDGGGLRLASNAGTSMELAFRTRKLRKLCQDHDDAVEAIGEAAADVLRTRLADLRAVTYLSDLPAGRPEILDDDPPRLRFLLRDGWALLASVSHQVTPRTPQGDLDMTRVRRALVQEVTR
jgi:hypothetical protein